MDLLFLKPRKSDEAGPREHCPGVHTRTAFAGFCVDRVYMYISLKCSYNNLCTNEIFKKKKKKKVM